MITPLLLLVLQSPAVAPTVEQVPRWNDETLAALDTHELVGLYPRQLRQHPLESEPGYHGWNPLAYELNRRLERGEVLRADEWRELLVGKGYLHMRPRWPVGEPLTLRVERPWVLRQGGIRLQPIAWRGPPVTGLHLATLESNELLAGCGMAIEDTIERDRQRVLGSLPRGRWHIDFRAEIVQSIAGPRQERIPGPRMWTGPLAFDVEIVDTPDEAVAPERDARWSELVRAGLRVWATKPEDEQRLVGIALQIDRARWPEDLHLELEVELVCGGCPYGKAELDDRRSMELPEDPIRRDDLLESLPWPVAHGDESAAGWTVRVHGVRGDALYDWDTTRWWAGEFEAPLADLIRR
ncbi:MAG: hypothetical protein IPJ19_14210 [Planctomycetes bacterium]|nr:hypothetical protein [Planctomycetota bacterium]